MAYELKDASISALSLGGEPRPRADESGVPKLSPDGRPTYSTGVVVARETGGIDRGITISVIEPEVFPLGTVVRVDGRTWLTPYVQDSGGRASIGKSFVCERLVAVTSSPARIPTKGE